MNKTTILFIFLLILLKINLSAQENGFVSGKVSEKAGNSFLPGAIISIDSKNGAATDIDGNFSLSATVGSHTVECSLLGYKNQKQTVTVKAGDTLKLNFILSEGNNLLDEVVVSAGKYEQKLSDVTVSMDVIKP